MVHGECHEIVENANYISGNKLPYSPNASRPAFHQVLPRIYAKFFNKPDSTGPSESSSSFHSLGFELLFSWSSFTTVTSRVRHLKMDSRDSAVKSGHEGTNVSKSVVRSQMDAISFTPLSRTFAKTSRIRWDCRKFFDKFPCPKSPVLSLKISKRYFVERAFKSSFNAGVNSTRIFTMIFRGGTHILVLL